MLITFIFTKYIVFVIEFTIIIPINTLTVNYHVDHNKFLSKFQVFIILSNISKIHF